MEPTTYVPSAMDPSMLAADAVVLGSVACVGAYWWFGVVPDARVRLARNKRSGALRTYLEDLREDDDRKLERWFFDEWLRKLDPETRFLLREDDAAETAAPRAPRSAASSSSLESDLERVTRLAKKTPKFWSWDNPVLVGTFLCVVIAGFVSGPPR